MFEPIQQNKMQMPRLNGDKGLKQSLKEYSGKLKKHFLKI